MMRSRLPWLFIPLLSFFIVGIKILTNLNDGVGAVNDISLVISNLALSIVGILIISRQPRNSIGWILITGSTCMFLAEFVYQLARYGLFTNPGSIPFIMVFAWFSLWLWTPVIFNFFILLPLLFPTGKPVSKGWRIILWIAWFELIGTILLFGFYPGPMEGLQPIDNPLGLPIPASIFDVLQSISTISLLILTGLAFFSVIIRYRMSGGEERIQLRWFLYAVALLFINATRGILSEDLVLFPQLPAEIDNILFAVNIGLIAVSIGIAILKYRLYEIDVIIRKTLVYGSLSFILALVYFGSITIIQGVIQPFSGQASSVGIVLSTLATAALFSPLRRRIQNAIDRRFYRSKYNTEKILSTFSTGLRDQIDFEQTTDQLLGLIQETMNPAHLSLWIKPNTTIEHGQ